MFKTTLFLLLFSLFSVLTIGQSYNESNLLIDYESSTAIELQQNLQTVLQTILGNVSTTEEIARVELIAFGEHRHVGEERMVVIQDFLVSKGIKGSKIELVTQFYNQEQVQVIIKIETAVITTKKQENIVANIAPKRYCAGASKAAQMFEIAANQNINIEGNEGTKIQINRADLVDKNGLAVEGVINIELKEFYKPADILLADLHTMDGDEILETGGMLNLVITANDEPLELRKGKTAKLQLPTQNAKSTLGMNLYLGAELEDGAVDWKRELPKKEDGFNLDSYVRLRKIEVLDSITYLAATSSNLPSNNYPIHRTKEIKHTHEEDYFDLELPYIPTPPPATNRMNWGGIWINIDRNFSIKIELPSVDPPPPPSVDILATIEGLPIGNIVNSPRVALMLKDRSVFLRGEFLPHRYQEESVNVVFERVPLNQEVVLIVYWSSEHETLFASKEFEPTAATSKQHLKVERINRTLSETLATLAN